MSGFGDWKTLRTVHTETCVLKRMVSPIVWRHKRRSINSQGIAYVEGSGKARNFGLNHAKPSPHDPPADDLAFMIVDMIAGGEETQIDAISAEPLSLLYEVADLMGMERELCRQTATDVFELEVDGWSLHAYGHQFEIYDPEDQEYSRPFRGCLLLKETGLP